MHTDCVYMRLYCYQQCFKMIVNKLLTSFSTISSYADLLTFVARFQSSSRDSLENAIKFIRANNDIKIGGILNDVKTAFLKVQF